MVSQALPPLVIQSAASTSIIITPVNGLVAPVPAGMLVYNGVVEPKNWTGTLSLIDADGLVLGNGGAAVNNSFTILTGPSGLSGGPMQGGTITANP
jgi:hypothetical protein